MIISKSDWQYVYFNGSEALIKIEYWEEDQLQKSVYYVEDGSIEKTEIYKDGSLLKSKKGKSK